MATHDKEGNRCLDVARSRYKYTLRSEQGTFLGDSTWHFTNPSMRQVHDKYSGNSVIMLRSFHIYMTDPASTHIIPTVVVHLDGLAMPNNAASSIVQSSDNERFGDMIQSSAIGVVDLLALKSPFSVGERFSGSVAECGQMVAGDLVNSDITVRIQGLGPLPQTAPVTTPPTPSYDAFFAATDKHQWVCELEVQTLLNYNKHDREY